MGIVAINNLDFYQIEESHGGERRSIRAGRKARQDCCRSVLILISVIVQSGVENYSAVIAGRIFAINVVAFAGLVLLNRLGARAGFAAGPCTRACCDGETLLTADAR